MKETASPQPTDNPWDDESIKLLQSLPHRQGIIGSCIPFLKLLAIPFLFIGGIGTFKQLAPVLNKGPEYEYAVEHFGATMLLLLLALAILGVGGLLWFLAERLMFQRAPLGDLAKALLEGIGKGKIDKVRTIARSICLQTEGRESDSLAIAFVRGVAFDILAETSPNEETAREMAQKAIPLFKRLTELGLNTPLLHFLLATSLRILKANQEAIAAYQAYLQMRPGDEGTRKIMDGLSTQKA
ncbi:MAG: tetratricopeptide repeat protein [Thermodesulfobacteriota bacterium]|nr:tetratricopeptide repeat protein [Thermodesulfobacteriota bacterium]